MKTGIVFMLMQSTKRFKTPSVANRSGEIPTESRMKMVSKMFEDGFVSEINWAMLPAIRIKQRMRV